MSIQSFVRQNFSQENSSVLQRKNEGTQSARKPFMDRSFNKSSQNVGSVKKAAFSTQCKNICSSSPKDFPEYLADICTNRMDKFEDFVLPEYSFPALRNLETPPPKFYQELKGEKLLEPDFSFTFDLIKENISFEEFNFKDIKEPEEPVFDFNL
nr:uncharacterized protein LOC111429027 [Onthophagus taurus]